MTITADLPACSIVKPINRTPQIFWSKISEGLASGRGTAPAYRVPARSTENRAQTLAADQISIRRYFPPKLVARPGRWLLAWRYIGIPDSAFSRRRHVSLWNIWLAMAMGGIRMTVGGTPIQYHQAQTERDSVQWSPISKFHTVNTPNKLKPV